MESLNNLRENGKEFINQNKKYKINMKSNKTAMLKY